MDAKAGLSLYPLHRTKTIHLVRHAQGIHNVEGDKDPNAYFSYDLFDAQLTPFGWTQVDNLRKHVQASGLSKKIDLVITSPLLRTMQTAVGVFGGGSYKDGINLAPLMVANAGKSDRPAITSFDSPPFIAVELCREDFTRMIREEALASIALFFLQLIFPWLWTRQEKEIAMVSHSGFLYRTLSSFGNHCHPTVKEEMCKHLANCELRSMVIVDSSLIVSDSSTTNYPGKVPNGLDLPTDGAH